MTMMHINCPSVYEWDGWLFEDSYCSGPWPLKQDGERRVNAGRKFWAMYEKWMMLSGAERESFRVGGGSMWVQYGNGELQ